MQCEKSRDNCNQSSYGWHRNGKQRFKNIPYIGIRIKGDVGRILRIRQRRPVFAIAGAKNGVVNGRFIPYIETFASALRVGWAVPDGNQENLRFGGFIFPFLFGEHLTVRVSLSIQYSATPRGIYHRSVTPVSRLGLILVRGMTYSTKSVSFDLFHSLAGARPIGLTYRCTNSCFSLSPFAFPPGTKPPCSPDHLFFSCLSTDRRLHAAADWVG